MPVGSKRVLRKMSGLKVVWAPPNLVVPPDCLTTNLPLSVRQPVGRGSDNSSDPSIGTRTMAGRVEAHILKSE